MKSRIIKATRKFTTEEYKGGDKALKFDFTELMKVMKDFAR